MVINKRKAEEWVRKSQGLWKRYSRHTEVATRVLRDIQRARDGGVVTKLVAAASIAGTTIKAVFPELSIEEELSRQGYHELRTSISGFLCGLVDQHKSPTRLISCSSSETAKVWERNGSGIAIVYRGEEYLSGPYLLAGDDSLLVDVVVSHVWRSESDLMLEKSGDDRIGLMRWGYRKYSLVDLPEPGPYIGKVGPRYWADKIALHKGKPRTILIKGPSGVGKSVMARHIGKMSCSGTSRTLKVTGKVLKDFRSGELRDIVKFLQPSVLLLDDLKVETGGYRGGEMIESLLDMLETLRVKNCTVIATKMEYVDRGNPRRGEHYVSGMRPGRVDLIIGIPAPDAEHRSDILKYYFDLYNVDQLTKKGQSSLVRMTQGLTGAYLEECVERISLYGVESMREEIINVLQAAPIKERKRKKGELIRSPVMKVERRSMSEKLMSSARASEKKASTLRNKAKRLENDAKKRREKAQEYAEKEKKKKDKSKKTKQRPKRTSKIKPKVDEALSKAIESAEASLKESEQEDKQETQNLKLSIVNPRRSYRKTVRRP